MRVQLPPKRWESTQDSKYDQIRHHKWFARLEKRKHHIPLLQQAYAMHLQMGQHVTQKFICGQWGVSEREFRDYCHHVDGMRIDGHISDRQQDAINHAYHYYQQGNASHSFTAHLKACAPQFGLNQRALIELWLTEPAFYPIGYIQ